MIKNRKGFTLIELLVVIAIIAVLAVVVVLTLNPAELLRQARDSNRLSDFANLKSALALYSTDVVTSTPMGTSTWFYLYAPTGSDVSRTTSTYYATSTQQGEWGFAGGQTVFSTSTGSAARGVGGAGWIPVNFNAISSGAPIAALPVDPSNSYSSTSGSSSLYAYIYVANSNTYKLVARTESVKYSKGGSADVESTDGGNSNYAYEQGTAVNSL